MKIYRLLLPLLGVTLMVGGCSTLKRQNAKTIDSGDARPLFPVTTVNTQGFKTVALDGRWYIKSVARMTLSGIEDNEWPFVEFVPTEGRFYGNNGCNVINGSYRVDAGQKLTLSNIATTMRLCADDTLSFYVDDALNNTASYSTAPSPDGSVVLSLHNARNQTVMTLRKSDIDFLNGAWQVTDINDAPCTAPDARLVFDVDGGRISGNAGCNRLMGEIARDPKVGASLQLSNLATTRMMCPDIETESALLIALEEVATARHSGDTAELLSAAGKVVVKLKRLTKEDLQTTEE